MKRLIKHSMQKVSRLKRKIFAEWQQINISDPDIMEQITNAMTYNVPMQIDYEGSGWRTIQPYGWNTSKDGNVLLMCYKDTGEVRSYRFDKIDEMYIDFDSNGVAINNNDQMNNDEQTQIYEDIMNDQGQDDYDMPSLPEEDTNNIDNKPGEFDKELQMLQNIPNQETEINQNDISNNIPENINENEEIKNDKE